MSDDQQYYWSKRHSWPLAVRFAYEFGGAAKHLRKFRNAYWIGAITFVFLVAAITWIKKDATVADLPLIILASTLHLLRGVAIVSLFFVWLGAKFIQDWLYERASNIWIEKERIRRPDVSFDVPQWRFFIPAVLARSSIFISWLGVMFYLLYVVPGRVSDLDRFIPDNFPI